MRMTDPELTVVPEKMNDKNTNQCQGTIHKQAFLGECSSLLLTGYDSPLTRGW